VNNLTKKTVFVLLVAYVIVISGCSSNQQLIIDDSSQHNPWNHLNFYNNPDNFQFAIIGDIEGGRRDGVFEEAIDDLNLMKPEFVMSVGDLVHGYYSKSIDKLRPEHDNINALINKLDMPFFYVPGNHDNTNELCLNEWIARYGKTYYHFIYKDVLFLCLDSQDPPDAHRTSNFSDKQLAYFQKVLTKYKNVRWTILFLHQPMWLNSPNNNDKNHTWAKMQKLLGERSYTVFCGHYHRYLKSIKNDMNHYILSTTGGGAQKAESTERAEKPAGVEYCNFDHIMWITMTKEGPLVTNILLDGIFNDEPCKATENQSKTWY